MLFQLGRRNASVLSPRTSSIQEAAHLVTRSSGWRQRKLGLKGKGRHSSLLSAVTTVHPTSYINGATGGMASVHRTTTASPPATSTLKVSFNTRPEPWSTTQQQQHAINFIHQSFNFSTQALSNENLEGENTPPSSSSSSSLPYTPRRRSGVRNVAIVAHVDHGKTTLVDELLKLASQSSSMGRSNSSSPASSSSSSSSSSEFTTETERESVHKADNTMIQEEQEQQQINLNRVMDSNELEKERGITITSKVTRLDYHPTNTIDAASGNNNFPTIINVVDTPGHADFAGEVDRILSMVDGVCLIVDAAEGPMAQTKYVLSRALHLGLIPLVVLNKIDRAEGLANLESGQVESDILDLFVVLDANEEQMEYVTLYGSARDGWITDDLDAALHFAKDDAKKNKIKRKNEMSMRVLLDAILQHIPEPTVHSYDDSVSEESNDGQMYATDKFSMAATTVGYDQYLGRTCTGRIYSGSISLNDSVTVLRRSKKEDSTDASQEEDEIIPPTNITGIFVNRGVQRTPLDPSVVASAGDIITLAGVPDTMAVGDTLTSASNPVPVAIETPPLAPPTLSVDFGPNDGPLAGQEGSIVTSSRVRSRLISETDNNVTITVTKSETDAERTVVYGRGELQLGILIEQMRREGYEFLVSPPQIVSKICPHTKRTLEPYEEVIVDVDAEYSGVVVNALTGPRGGLLLETSDGNAADGKTRLVFEVPSRGLLGFRSEIATTTRGTAVVHHRYVEDRPWAGLLGRSSDRGKLVSNALGKASSYALNTVQERGTLFVEPGDDVYPGMVIGENTRSGDLEVNPVRAKAATNIRTVNKDEKVYLAPPKRMTVEELIGYMNDDEIIEVTPKNVRLRKAELDSGARQRAARSRKKQLNAAKELRPGKKK